MRVVPDLGTSSQESGGAVGRSADFAPASPSQTRVWDPSAGPERLEPIHRVKANFLQAVGPTVSGAKRASGIRSPLQHGPSDFCEGACQAEAWAGVATLAILTWTEIFVLGWAPRHSPGNVALSAYPLRAEGSPL